MRVTSPSRNLPGPGPFRTVANVVTIVRTLAAVALGVLALRADEPFALLVAGYATFWVGDSLDGLAARLLDQETRAGAVFDIASDRLCTSVLAVGLITYQPHLTVAVVIFLVGYMVVDEVLSLSFLHWPLVSPNHFDRVDPLVHRWNWSHPAKALNNIGIVAAVLIGDLWFALAVVTVQLVVKLASAVRVARLLGDRT